MQLQQETGSKQHILAEDSLGNNLIPSLSQLIITHYTDCIALAVFSSLEKKLLAYKITNPVSNLSEVEQWLHEDFNRTVIVSFTRYYEVTPELFTDNSFDIHNPADQMTISFKPDNPGENIHYITALAQYHLTDKRKNQIYLFRQGDYFSILLMNGEDCLLANTFECENENEVLYFLLNALQISDILPSDTTLNADYSLTDDETVLQFLAPHFAKTELLKLPADGLNHAIPQLPEKLFACYAASLCV